MRRLCEICGNDEKKRIFKQKFINPSKNYFHSGYDVVICAKCGFAFADNIPDQKFLDSYYREMTKKTFYKSKRINEGKKSPEENFLIRQLTNSANNIEKYLKKQNSILDIGCDTGVLLSLLKKRGYKNLKGIDMSKLSSKIAKEKYGIDVIVGSIFENLNIGKFDFIILTHVMEHINNLNAFVKKLMTFLNDGGLIYIEVPDAHNFFFPKENDNYYSNDQKEPYLQFSVEHINYYSKISLFNLMTQNGFEKLFLQSQISTISVIASVWSQKGILKDETIKEKLEKYIDESKNKLVKINEIIGSLIKNKTEIIVWGTGLHTQKLLSLTELMKVRIIKFVDSDPGYQGHRLINKQIIKPDEIIEENLFPILISTKRYQTEIMRQIKKLGLKNKIIKLY